MQYAAVYGMIFMLLNTIALAFSDLSAKIVTTEVSSSVVTFMYKFSLLILILPWVLKDGIKGLKTDKVHVHLFRSFFSVAGVFCFIEGFKRGVPMADAAIFENFQYIMLIVISMMFFNDSITKPKIVAIVLGFVGAILTVAAQIGKEAVDITSYGYTFLAICFWSLNSVSVKILGYTEKNKTQMFYLLLFAVMWIMPKLLRDIIDWDAFDQGALQIVDIAIKQEHMLLILFMSFCYFVHGVCYFKALKFDFSLVVPFRYTKLVFSGLLGYIFFNEVPSDVQTLLGYSLIIASSIILYKFEKNRAPNVKAIKKEIDKLSVSNVNTKVTIKSEA